MNQNGLNIIRRGVLLGLVGFFMSSAEAANYYWIGAPGASNILDSANFSGDPYAAWGHTIIFTNETPLTLYYPISRSGANYWPSKIRVEKASVYLGREPGSGEKEYRLQDTLKPEIYVAAGSVFSVTNCINPYNASAKFTKTGPGAFEICGSFDSGHNFTNLTVAAGTFRVLCSGGIQGRVSSHHVVVRDGARFELVGPTKDNPMNAATRVTVDEGAVLSLNSVTTWFSDVSGAGTVEGVGAADSTLQLQVNAADIARYSFDGDFTGRLWLLGVAGTTSRFVFSQNALADIKGIGLPDCFTWEAGVVRPVVPCVTGNSGGILRLEDENGDPIVLETKIVTPTTLGTTGAGDLVVTNSGEVVLNGSKYLATGTLRAAPGTVLKLGTERSDGTGDFDLVTGRPSRLDLEYGAALNFCGITSNVVAVPVTGVGTVTVSKTAKRFEDFRADARILNGDTKVTFAGGDGVIRYWKGHGGAARTHTFSGGRFTGQRNVDDPVDPLSVLKLPTGVEFSGASGWYGVENTGAELITVFGAGHKNMFLRGGRTIVCGERSLSNSGNAIADGGNSQLVFDGGELVYRRTSNSGEYRLLGSSSRGKSALYVGEKGGRLTFDNPVPGHRANLYIDNAIETLTNVTASGKLTIAGFASVWFDKPVSTSGGLRLADCRLVLYPGVSAGGTDFLGTGDFELDNASTLYQKDWAKDGNLHLATDPGAAFRFFGASRFGTRLDGGVTQGQTITAGALERGGAGAVLLLSDIVDTGWGDKVKFFVSGGAVTNETTGLPTLPILVGTDATHHFAEYDPTCGFKVYSRYATQLTSGEVVNMTDSTTLSADLAVAGLRLADYRDLNIASGVTLSVGNGTDPAMIAYGSAAKLSGAGTVDFGTSEGILAAGNTTKSDPHRCQAVLAGSGGVSFVGFFCGEGDSCIRVSGDNTYTGGTWVNGTDVFAAHEHAFSSGPVRIGGDGPVGGRVRLEAAGGTFANAFSLGGIGPQYNDLGQATNGCLRFARSATVTGPIELRHTARVTVADDEEGVFAGTVSGDRLQVYAPGGVLELASANTYTGGTSVVAAQLAIRCAEALGTGALVLDNGTLICRNATDMTITNDLTGVGTVRMTGAGAVHFAGDTSDFTGILDIAGKSRRIATLEPFVGVQNSARRYAELTLSAPGAYRLDPAQVSGKIGIVLEKGATLDLGGGTLNVYNFIGDTADVNGTVVSQGGPKGMLLIVR